MNSGGRHSPVIIQAGFDLRLVLRNGEQLLLTMVIPIGLLLGTTLVGAVPLSAPPGAARSAEALGGVLAVAIVSSAFTSLAISLGFDRRSGALLMWATTPLSRSGILVARILATLAVVAVQALLLVLTALALGWRPGTPALALPFVLAAGTACFASLGFALGGAVRAEATLALANAIFLILVIVGGTTFPTTSLPVPLATVVGLLPSAALGDLLRWTTGGTPVPVTGLSLTWDVFLLCAWGLSAAALSARTFRCR